MVKRRPEEDWAARVISAALGGVPVSPHDDGSRPGMHDLNIDYPERPRAAVEVTTATDPAATVLWRLVNPPGSLWTVPGLTGGWVIAVEPTADVRRLRRELPALLHEVEALGMPTVGSAEGCWPAPDWSQATALGITRAFRGRTDHPGSVYVTVDLPDEQTGGVVAADGEALPAWVNGWVRDERRADNLCKLAASGAAERHLFVILRGFSGAPFPVTDLLLRDAAPLPTRPPGLPGEITHLWTMSTWDTGQACAGVRRPAGPASASAPAAQSCLSCSLGKRSGRWARVATGQGDDEARC